MECLKIFVACFIYLYSQQCSAMDLFGLNIFREKNDYVEYMYSIDQSFPVSGIALSPDGTKVAINGWTSRELEIWSLDQRKKIKTLHIPNITTWPRNIAWSSNGKYLAVCGSSESSLRIFRTEDWNVERDFNKTQIEACQMPRFSPDSSELTILAADLITLKVGTWTELRRLVGVPLGDTNPAAWNNDKDINNFIYLPNSHSILLAGYQFLHMNEMRQKYKELCFDPESSQLGGIWVLKEQNITLSEIFPIFCNFGRAEISALSINPGSTLLAAATETPDQNANSKLKSSIRILSMNDHKISMPYSLAGIAWVNCLAYTPDGKFLLAGYDGSATPDGLVVIKPSTSEQLVNIKLKGPVTDLVVSDVEKLFLVAVGNRVEIYKYK